jgi:predicted RNA-binding Zn-ribbon protein involved in translation (DUF1610 family)
MALDDGAFLTKAQAMCRSKAAYISRREAIALLRRHGLQAHPYPCPWCGNWHITTYNRARGKAFSRRLSRLLRDHA